MARTNTHNSRQSSKSSGPKEWNIIDQLEINKAKQDIANKTKDESMNKKEENINKTTVYTTDAYTSGNETDITSDNQTSDEETDFITDNYTSTVDTDYEADNYTSGVETDFETDAYTSGVETDFETDAYTSGVETDYEADSYTSEFETDYESTYQQPTQKPTKAKSRRSDKSSESRRFDKSSKSSKSSRSSRSSRSNTSYPFFKELKIFINAHPSLYKFLHLSLVIALLLLLFDISSRVFSTLINFYYDFLIETRIYPIIGLPNNPVFIAKHRERCNLILHHYDQLLDDCYYKTLNIDKCLVEYISIIDIDAKFCKWNVESIFYAQHRHLQYLSFSRSIKNFFRNLF